MASREPPWHQLCRKVGFERPDLLGLNHRLSSDGTNDARLFFTRQEGEGEEQHSPRLFIDQTAEALEAGLVVITYLHFSVCPARYFHNHVEHILKKAKHQ